MSPYARKLLAPEKPSSSSLTSDLAGIGMHFAAKPNREANIEDTIFFASLDGMEKEDLRTPVQPKSMD